jgi:hypothetical protein
MVHAPPPTPTIYFCGDVHGNFDHVIAAVQRGKPDAIIFLGDLEAQQPLSTVLAPIVGTTQIHWIHGNHDTDTAANYQNVYDCSLGSQNLHGRVVDICGVRVAGLGGIFRNTVWMPPAPPRFDSYAAYIEDLRAAVPPQSPPVGAFKGQVSRGELTHKSTIFPDVYQQLALLRADILVTHEAPSCHPKGFLEVDRLARALGAVKSFHGHHHDRLDYSVQWEGLGFMAFGVGFCGISDLDGNLVLPGDFD